MIAFKQNSPVVSFAVSFSLAKFLQISLWPYTLAKDHSVSALARLGVVKLRPCLSFLPPLLD